MKSIIPTDLIERKIHFIRDHKVMLSHDVAALYGVEARILNQAVKRNIDRFPDDFMFQLSTDEYAALKSQIETSSWGGRRTAPYAFTEQGVAMLSGVLNSKRAVAVNIEIIRVFVRLRRMLASNEELSRKLADLEKNYDAKFKVVFDAIRQLMTPPVTKRRKMGFHFEDES